MTTIEIVKARIEKIDRKVNSLSEIEAAAPNMKRVALEGYERMRYVLQNPETLKWAVITDETATEISVIYHEKKTGFKPSEDPFMFH